MPPQNKDSHFKLVSLSGIAFRVIQTYIEERILRPDSFETFLNKEKHTLVHMYDTSPCCNCKSETIIRDGLLTRKQLLLLYKSDETKQIHDSKKLVGRKLSSICICKYSAKVDIEVKDLDLSLATLIIAKCRTCDPGIDIWIQKIKDMRNEIFHLSNIHEIADDKFIRKWNEIEGSIMEIANCINNVYHEETRKKILQTKKLTITYDYLLEYEILCRDLWKQKCVDFEVRICHCSSLNA